MCQCDIEQHPKKRCDEEYPDAERYRKHKHHVRHRRHLLGQHLKIRL